MLEKAFAVGAGGIVGQNVRLALSGLPIQVYDVVAGLGGRAITKARCTGCFDDVLADRLEPRRLHFLDLDTRPRPARARARGERRGRARTPRTSCATSATSHVTEPARDDETAAGDLRCTAGQASTRRAPSRSATGCSTPSSAPCRRGRERSNTLTSGHRACQGCGEALGARYALDAAMRATDGQLIAANATGCLEVFSTPFPESSWQLPWIHSLFGNAPAVATGIAAALKVKGRTDVRVVGQGGDGGTVDIGFALPVGDVRAQRRRALHLLRQRGLHEHRRAALRRDAAGGPHRDDEAGRRASRATSSARARTCR